MKSNKHSKVSFKHSDIEKNDIGSQFGKGAKKDKTAKKRLSIYDEFEEDDLDLMKYKSKDEELFDDDEE
ncbi:hypothetical protein [Mangrovibacterium sp.]|uniref:hypothetical protein n=1 Tax=Mangrovibacterium sp. TaxID=1961364 RepID=UPI0035696D68